MRCRISWHKERRQCWGRENGERLQPPKMVEASESLARAAVRKVSCGLVMSTARGEDSESGGKATPRSRQLTAWLSAARKGGH